MRSIPARFFLFFFDSATAKSNQIKINMTPNQVEAICAPLAIHLSMETQNLWPDLARVAALDLRSPRATDLRVETRADKLRQSPVRSVVR